MSLLLLLSVYHFAATYKGKKQTFVSFHYVQKTDSHFSLSRCRNSYLYGTDRTLRQTKAQCVYRNRIQLVTHQGRISIKNMYAGSYWLTVDIYGQFSVVSRGTNIVLITAHAIYQTNVPLLQCRRKDVRFCKAF